MCHKTINSLTVFVSRVAHTVTVVASFLEKIQNLSPSGLRSHATTMMNSNLKLFSWIVEWGVDMELKRMQVYLELNTWESSDYFALKKCSELKVTKDNQRTTMKRIKNIWIESLFTKAALKKQSSLICGSINSRGVFNSRNQCTKKISKH